MRKLLSVLAIMLLLTTFQLAEVAVSKELFEEILRLIA